MCVLFLWYVLSVAMKVTKTVLHMKNTSHITDPIIWIHGHWIFLSLPYIVFLACLELLCLIYLRASGSLVYLRIKIHTAMPDGVN